MPGELAGGVLKFSILWRGKRTPWDKGATAFIPLEYDICGEVAPGLGYGPLTASGMAVTGWEAIGSSFPPTAVARDVMSYASYRIPGR